MAINAFKLEEYLVKHEFSAPYLLCCSDAESFAMQDIIAMADAPERNLWNNLRLSYTEAQGLPVLRYQIAQSLYPTLKADNIQCFSGAEEGIFCALHAICEPSDHVIVLTPCYQSLMEIPKLRGCDVTAVELLEENDWRIDLGAIKMAINPNTKLIITNFPHNPTGQVIRQWELDKLVGLCEQYGIWLFADEVYAHLGSPDEPHSLPAAEVYPRALSLGVTSKSFGMAGLRIGWIACQDKALLTQIQQIRHYTSICSSAPSEILTLIALKNKDKILDRNNIITSANLRMLDNFFEEYKGLFSWVRPQGGCTGFVKLKSDERVDLFCDRLVRESGVLLMPASIYDCKSNHFRIGFGRKNMPEALDKFRQFLEL